MKASVYMQLIFNSSFFDNPETDTFDKDWTKTINDKQLSDEWISRNTFCSC